MKRFAVQVHEVHVSTRIVEAHTPEEARERAEEGEEEDISLSHTINRDEWKVEELRDKTFRVWKQELAITPYLVRAHSEHEALSRVHIGGGQKDGETHYSAMPNYHGWRIKEVGEEEEEVPRYTHDCEPCVFLGGTVAPPESPQYYDLYWCPQGGFPTVLARFADEGPAYTSGLVAAIQQKTPAYVPSVLLEALRRAEARGLVGPKTAEAKEEKSTKRYEVTVTLFYDTYQTEMACEVEAASKEEAIDKVRAGRKFDTNRITWLVKEIKA